MRHSTFGLLAVGLLAGLAGRLAAADKTDPKAIVLKAIEAMGGEEKLARSKSVLLKGKCTFYGMGRPIECTGEWLEELPAQLKVVYHMKMRGKDVIRIEVIGKDQGWLVQGGKGRALPADQLAEIHEGLQAGYIATVLPLKDPAYRLTAVENSEVEGRLAVGLKVSREGRRDVFLYFDKQQGVLVKMRMRTKGMAGGEVEDETVYSDYQDFGPFRSYKKMTTKRDGKPFLDCEFTEHQPVDKFPDGTFAKPAAAQ
jgi:hypothetical protein